MREDTKEKRLQEIDRQACSAGEGKGIRSREKGESPDTTRPADPPSQANQVRSTPRPTTRDGRRDPKNKRGEKRRRGIQGR